MRKILQLVSVFVMVVINANTGQSNGASERWIPEAEATLARTDSYTAIFHKQERVKGTLKAEEVAFLKFGKPFKVYMK